MKKVFSLLFVFLLVCTISTSASAYNILSNGDFNEIYFQNVEMLFDSTGNALDLSDPDITQVRGILPGDVFLGIINAQNVDVNSSPFWQYDSIANPDAINLSGIFAQEVDYIDPVTNIIYIKATNQTMFTVTNQDSSTDTFDISPYLSTGEILALYVDTNTDGTFTAYNSNGTVWQDIQSATDSDTGDAWLTAGLVEVTDYAYSDGTLLGSLLGNFEAITYSGLSVMENNTGFALFEKFDDAAESMINTDVDLAFTAHIKANNQYPSSSPWQIYSEDPAGMKPIPEPATVLLFGIGLLGFASLGRRKRK